MSRLPGVVAARFPWLRVVPAVVAARFPWLRAVPAGQLRAAALSFLALAAVLGVLGGTWDAAWHVTLRRETFWSPPHLLLYSGTTIALGAALTGLAGRWFRGASVWRSEPGFALAALGAAVVIGAAPLDDFWHRTFGRDVDVWSFPHLVALAGGCGINIGAALACEQMLERQTDCHPRLIRAAMLVFLTALLWVTMFGLNWYTLVLAQVRDSLRYPLLATLAAVPGLVLARALLGRGGATLASAAYMAYVIGAHGLLNVVGYALLPFPPALIVAAVPVDLIFSGSPPTLPRGLGTGLAFVPVFLLAETASLAWYPHPALPPPNSEAMRGYISMLADHPWDPVHVATSLPLLLLAGAVAGALGTLVVRQLQVLLLPKARP